MKEFLLTNCQTMVWIVAAIEFVFLFVLAAEYKKQRRPMVLCMLLIDLGLFIDAFFIALGAPTGGLPDILGQLRFIAHGVLIPLIFPICGYGLKLGKKAMKILWIFTSIVMALGLAEGCATQLELKTIGEVLRHVSSAATPGWATGFSMAISYGTVIPLIIVGIVVWIKQKTPHLFLAGFLMFAFSALGPATGNFDHIFFITMIGEVLMVLFLWLYAKASREATKE